MINKDGVHINIKQLYFDLTLELTDNLQRSFYDKLADGLQKITEASSLAIYQCDPWTSCYFKRAESFIAEETFADQFVMDENESAQSAIQNMVSPEERIQVLQTEVDCNGLIIAATRVNEDIKQDTWNIVAQETEKLLRVFVSRNEAEDDKRKLSFLFNLSAKLNGLYTKAEILQELKHALEVTYPEFSYELLLSQDFEAVGILPVQLIAYADDMTKRVSSQAFMTGDIQIENRWNDRTTCIYAPLRGDQGVYGVLKIVAGENIHFPEDELSFVSRFSNVVGKAIENASLYERSNRLVNDLKWMNEVTQQLNSNLELEDIVTLVRDRTIEVSEATQLGVVFINESYDQSFQVRPGSTDYFFSEQGTVFVEYIVETMLQEKDIIFTGDMASRTDLTAYCSVMAIPMLQGGKLEGIIIAMHEASYHFSLDTLKLVQSFIQHSSLAFSNALLKAELEKTVITDYLTQLYTRSYVDEKVISHMDSGECGALVFFDIDNFKQVNDTYGHHIGDEVLIQVAQIIERHLTGEEIACRWGGEEIAVYLPESGIKEGLEIAKSIREQVAKESEPTVTLSCGIASWTQNTPDSARALFARSDQALYQAKQTGKNKVVLANQPYDTSHGLVT
ncbi:sensor domain-containing diguanylate cyclase [Lentibacillus saliphilus]|uniref:sensor domain-containing diguanylate cyclase n=1 Tax=Lentibacillus saliphilus TaxID=2737028 RepID=UPI001C301EA6|nr:diguanylate cyclase [Lentibacillus saliphilus]